MTFIGEMEAFADALRSVGFRVETPVREEVAVDWNSLSEVQSFELKRAYIDAHLAKIRESDLVLLANYRKNGVDGYIGANSLMEAAFAYALGVPVAYLRPVGDQPCRLEVLSISQLVTGEDIGNIETIFR